MDNIYEMEQQIGNISGTVIEIVESGPIKITGNFHLKDLKRNIEEFSSEVSLCRCGKSDRKPYCDDSCKK